jgi:gluconokinase
VARTIKQREEAGETLVVACSALKRKYRDWMREIVPHLVFVHLSGDQELIAGRLTRRNHEFMPATLLDSQYETLEELGSDEEGVVVDITISPDTVVEQILSELSHSEAIPTSA